MIRVALVIAVLVFGRAALAQPVALGKPLPDPALPAGTLMVRVVAGSPSSPAVGVVVTVKVDGKPRTATTGSDGRVTFPGIPVGAKVDVSTPSKAPELAHGSFVIPARGGTRVMLSTTRWGLVASKQPEPRDPRTTSIASASCE